MSLLARDLTAGQAILGTFSPSQNRTILIVSVTCASISLLATLVTLRWFILMKRLFRHHLVLLLLISDTIKALSYFIFPAVVLANGPVDSSSKRCQVSGFFLAFSIEASDFAILLIALHAVLYVFRPPIRFGEGGLFPYRKWILLAWLVFPVLAASLAFVNKGNGYVSAGTFCYLPQRPFWYRLALAWIPRYLILITILLMYAAILIYVRIKFQSFKTFAHSEPSSGFQSGHRLSYADPESPASPGSPDGPQEKTSLATAINGRLSPLVEHPSPRLEPSNPPDPPTSNPSTSMPSNPEPWDSVAFITTSPFAATAQRSEGIVTADFAPAPHDTVAPSPHLRPEDAVVGGKRKSSNSPTLVSSAPDASTRTSSRVNSTIDDPGDRMIADPLKRTRLAIRQQLRFLFIYPAVYILMWVFPFANHCLLYSDYLATRPIFWLQILSTCSLSLQAAANCAIFSTREKPWRRIDENSRLSLKFWRRQGVTLVRNMHSGSALFGPRNASVASTARRTTNGTDVTLTESRPPPSKRGPTWWEAEGKKRKDSVWLGTDLMTYITSRDSEGAPSTKSKEHEEDSQPAPS